MYVYWQIKAEIEEILQMYWRAFSFPYTNLSAFYFGLSIIEIICLTTFNLQFRFQIG